MSMTEVPLLKSEDTLLGSTIIEDENAIEHRAFHML